MAQQHFNAAAALNITGFHKALRYYVLKMRHTDYIRAYHALMTVHGDRLAFEVSQFCLEMVITKREECGRIFLADGYEKRMP